MVLFSLGFAWVPLVEGGGVELLAAWLLGAPLLALVPAAFSVGVAFLGRTLGRAFALAAAPGLWVALEALRTQGEFGVPWLHLGYAVADTPLLIQLASLGGVFLLSLWIVGTNVALAALRRPLGAGRLALAAGIGAGPVLYGALALRAAPVATDHLRIAAVQPQQEAAGGSPERTFDAQVESLLSLSENARAADLLVWPETAYPRPVGRSGDAFLGAIAHHLGVPLLTGVRRVEPERELPHYNAAALLNARGQLLGTTDKLHPVPYFERAPGSHLSRALARLGVWPGGIAPGAGPELLVLGRSGRPALPIGVLICIDASDPSLARELVSRGAQLLVAISNERIAGAWAAHQHARMSRVRAVEAGLPLVRAANTGPSEWVDARGRRRASLPAGERASATATLPIAPPRTTPYAATGGALMLAAGLLPPLAALAIALLQTSRVRVPRSRASLNGDRRGGSVAGMTKRRETHGIRIPAFTPIWALHESCAAARAGGTARPVPAARPAADAVRLRRRWNGRCLLRLRRRRRRAPR